VEKERRKLWTVIDDTFLYRVYTTLKKKKKHIKLNNIVVFGSKEK
jgi:hypothetical protein